MKKSLEEIDQILQEKQKQKEEAKRKEEEKKEKEKEEKEAMGYEIIDFIETVKKEVPETQNEILFNFEKEKLKFEAEKGFLLRREKYSNLGNEALKDLLLQRKAQIPSEEVLLQIKEDYKLKIYKMRKQRGLKVQDAQSTKKKHQRFQSKSYLLPLLSPSPSFSFSFLCPCTSLPPPFFLSFFSISFFSPSLSSFLLLIGFSFSHYLGIYFTLWCRFTSHSFPRFVGPTKIIAIEFDPLLLLSLISSCLHVDRFCVFEVIVC